MKQMLVALGDYKWVLAELDTNSGPGFAYPVVEAHAQNTIKESEQKMLHQSGWLTIISLDQGTYLTNHNVQQWAVRYPPQSTSSMEN